MTTLLIALIYLCFISLGLPDSLLGSAWPVMQNDIGAPMSFVGVISLSICAFTVVSSLFSDALIRKFGAGLLTAVSTVMTAVALFGFSISTNALTLVLWSVPYGLGAGAIDAVLNNYVALHFKAQHMSWLHCFWGVGASISPYIMSFALVRLENWSSGYLIVSIIQISISALIFASIPLWKRNGSKTAEISPPAMKISDVFKIKGAVACLLTFFCYCSLELTTSLWASSYLVETRGVDTNTAAAFASLFYIGITVGRGINGFLAMRFSDTVLIRSGLSVIAVGVALVFIPFSSIFALVGFVVMGLGCAPIYPCIIHSTPVVFGRDKSQAMIGIQMAFAYIGFCVMPPLFGIIAEYISTAALPFFLLMLLVLMTLMHEVMLHKTDKG